MRSLLSFLVVLILSFGCAGPKGDTGATGPKGDKGDKGNVGSVGTQGAPGKDGLTVEAIYNLFSDGNDLCTKYSNEACVFVGGKLVKFSNDTYQIDGQIWGYYYNVDDKDTDHFRMYNSMWALDSYAVWVSLGAYARAGSNSLRMIALMFDPITETAQLWYDTNNDSSIDIDDDFLLETLMKVEI